jgi:hypothetical protein
MPISLNDSEKLSVPQREIAAAEADLSWLHMVVIHVPKEGTWSAVTEGYPMDSQGTVYPRNPITGEDTTIRIESADLLADAQQSPALAAAINQVMAGIITATVEIKALRDAEKAAIR